MAQHAATTPATQTAYPWRAAARTMVAVGLPVFTLTLLVAPQVIQVLLSGYGPMLPASAQAWLLGAAAFITATSGVITRIMAIPAVIELTHFAAPYLAPVPAAVPAVPVAPAVLAPAPAAVPAEPVAPVAVPAAPVAAAPEVPVSISPTM